MIQNIDISKIFPHPDNPRKDLGDITELADSIKANGIFQNLTVVPLIGDVTEESINGWEGDYTVVIGHRRLAAAKLAGLTEVPCAISDMDYRKQISTMLLENMQRSDLTVYEQAQGFQMMLDLGESINDISQNTGFSETTVRRRVKLLDLDKDKFRQSVDRGGTLTDYAELEKIRDIKLRNKVLEQIGTENFRWELKQAIDKEKREDSKAMIIAELDKFATKTNKSTGLQYVESFYPLHREKVAVPEDADSVEYFYIEDVSNYSGIALYKKADKSNSDEDQSSFDERNKERTERREALRQVSEQAYALRVEFVKQISNTTAKKNVAFITEYLLRGLFNDEYFNYPDPEDLMNFIGVQAHDDDEEIDFEKIKDAIANQYERQLLLLAYLTLDSKSLNCYDWEGRYQENEGVNTVYDFLVRFGYEVSDEEAALRDGTHELFASAEEE